VSDKPKARDKAAKKDSPPDRVETGRNLPVYSSKTSISKPDARLFLAR
jgi:hypothetical protein